MSSKYQGKRFGASNDHNHHDHHEHDDHHDDEHHDVAEFDNEDVAVFDEDEASNLSIIAIVTAVVGLICLIVAFTFASGMMVYVASGVAILTFGFAFIFAASVRKADQANGYESDLTTNLAYWIGLIGAIIAILFIIYSMVYVMGQDPTEQSGAALAALVG